MMTSVEHPDSLDDAPQGVVVTDAEGRPGVADAETPGWAAGQKLHGATFLAERGTEVENSGAGVGSQGQRSLGELLDQIGQGLREDDASNFEKLRIARKYGPLLWELKSLAPHGAFQQTLRERFPKVSYPKCNRWMFLAKHEAEIVAALERHPDVAWGPKKMIDYLKGAWVPNEEVESEEDDCLGNSGESSDEPDSAVVLQSDADVPDDTKPDSDDDSFAPESDATSPFAVGAFNPALATAIAARQEGVTKADPAAAKAARTQPHGKSKPGGGNYRPPINRTEYQVDVGVGFKLSVPDGVTAEEITDALRVIDRWTVAINTPFDYEMSEKGVVVRIVQPWERLDSSQEGVVHGAKDAP